MSTTNVDGIYLYENKTKVMNTKREAAAPVDSTLRLVSQSSRVRSTDQSHKLLNK